MVHGHPVLDADKHFIIDPVTRDIKNAEMKKTVLIQNDHNSERFSFELDKLVEGHDMMKCNKVEVHYLNTASQSRLQRTGVYEVDDLQVAESDSNKIVFTWLVSENATYYAGTLSFLVLFACVEDTVCTYKWHTGINTSMTIAKGMNNGEAVTSDPYPDILEQWREKLFSKNYAYEDAVLNGFDGSEEDWYNAIVGSGNAGATALVAKNLAQEAKDKADVAYSPDNVPPYPVTSVNDSTGAVTITTVYDSTKRYFTGRLRRSAEGRTPAFEITDDAGTIFSLYHQSLEDGTDDNVIRVEKSDGTVSFYKLYDSNNPPPSNKVTTGGTEGQILAVNANGTISPNSRTIASLGTGATYSLNGTTLTITTIK